jgi:UDP-glucose 4-epimerase
MHEEHNPPQISVIVPCYNHGRLQHARAGHARSNAGGQEKTLDFTYIDDCVDGIVAGIERLTAGRVINQTINLAYGQGNTLVHMAELIAQALNLPPCIEVEPTKRIGEVTRYIADISRAVELLEYRPRVPLDEGIRRAVAWAAAWEAAHDKG